MGLRLPLVFPLLEVVTVNTTGARRLKTRAEMRDAGDDGPVAHDSRVDKFDQRLALLNRTAKGRTAASEMAGELRYMSLHEFNWKFYVHRGRICRSRKPVSLMMTPTFSADCANMLHDRHEAYARSAVVAYWRLMPTRARHEAIMKHQHLREEDLATTDTRTWGTTEFVAPLARFLGVQDLVRKFDGRKYRGKEVGWGRALMEMLVDPMLVAWVPGWVVEQYERWNPEFRGSLRWATGSHTDKRQGLRTRTNVELLRVTRRKMVARHERRQAEKESGKTGDQDSGATSSGSGNVGSEGEEEEKEEEEDPELVAAALAEKKTMVWEPLPSADGPDGEVGGGDWERASVAERLSAAGAAPAAADMAHSGTSEVLERGVARVNPPGHVWVSAVSRAMHAKRLERLWTQWKDEHVDDDGDGVSREDLDAWQKFAYDVAMFRAAERERLSKQSVTQLSGFRPLRELITGSAGAGKSRTIRAIVRARRRVVMEHGGDKETVSKSCALAAPTGCASFHMKYGASTCHRLFGLPAFGYVGRLTQASKRLPVLKRRLKGARTLVLDEFSMLGKIFTGKMLLRARDVWGSKPPAFRRDVTMGGLDVIVAGHSAQAQPIGDDSLCKVGPYTGRGRNQPKDGVDATAPSCEALSNDAELFMKEFEDVALLRRV